MAEGNPAVAAEQAAEEQQQQQLAKEEAKKEEASVNEATPNNNNTTDNNDNKTDEPSASKEEEQAKQSSVAAGEHKLQSLWTIWFNDIGKSKPSAQPPDEKEYEKRLQKVGHFETLEGFWAHYRYLVRPSQLNKLTTLSIFRNDTKPTWENYEEGGHWLVTIAKRGDNNHWLDRLWEQLIFALIGEEFEEPLVVGVVVQVRIKEDVLSVWLGDKAPKFRVGEKLKQILHLQPSTVIEYKNNKSSLKDASGLRNAQAYYVGEDKKSEAAAAAAAAAAANNTAPVPGQA